VNISTILWILATLILAVGVFFSPEYFFRFLFIVLVVTLMFFVNLFIEKKRLLENTTWRLLSGVIHFTLAVLFFIWLIKFSLRMSIILLMIGVVILALVGAGDIMIALLNHSAEKKHKPQP
jgi:hypothetical protein